MFVEEQGVPVELEYDEHDAAALHFLVYCTDHHDGDSVGCGRDTVDRGEGDRARNAGDDGSNPRPIAASRMVRFDERSMKIGRMAVLAEARGSGAGRAMLDHLVDRARALGVARAVLNAQAYVVAFYEKAGFLTVGPGHVEAGIPHQFMERMI